MKLARFAVILVLVAGIAGAQTVRQLRPVSPAVATPISPAATANGVSLAKDYEALYRKEVEKSRELKSQVQSLTERLAEVTRPGGSLVTAYCESASVSRNTAGASNDCSTSGFACEPVSGLCRTSAHSSAECAAGFVYCSTRASCVRTADECQ